MSYTLTFQDGDIVLDSRGRVQTISSLDKVSQEVLGALLLRFDPPHVVAGSNFYGLIDTIAANARFSTLVQKELMDAVQRLKEVQTSQRPALPDDEVIDHIEDIRIRHQEQGVIDLSFRIVVRSGQSRVIDQEVVLNSVTLDTLQPV